MYISLWENYRGHPDNISFMQFSTKIYGFEQKDSQGFENSYNSYEQYPLIIQITHFAHVWKPSQKYKHSCQKNYDHNDWALFVIERL